ncbi:sarcosine oxidase [Paecilomyces variotii No. 5]|uniref:Sarcosine oxidase n=1 Tax=Byssochlamys spectabilis (strain No. 5 / NBRC 109023) TaxID=1356009 RepID=V5HYS5_BYSSN|nr:sarcosine oxidase [Paecilomyces variotii No. 5]
MAPQPLLIDKNAPIVIVGAGIFGLSSAIHLAKRGFKNITVFDKQPYHETLYDFDRGCDAASADCNKIIRAAYGHETWYQNLTFEAIQDWNAWNESLATGADLPPGMTTKDRIYVNCGNYHIGDENGANGFEDLSIKNITAAGHGNTQYLLTDPKEVTRARRDGFNAAIDPFNLHKGQDRLTGHLDMVGGFVYADKACRFALHKAQSLGVKFILDPSAGQFSSFVEEKGAVTGIKTADGKTHSAALTIVACGGWTPTLLPELDGLCETTAGSVAMIQIPEGSPLRERFSAERFPVWHYKMRGGANGSLYGFPIDERGVMKLGYRGTKYTNPALASTSDKKTTIRSTPITKYTSPSIHTLPAKSVEVIRGFLDKYLPELGAAGLKVTTTRLCWYTDTFDNHFVIDSVPSKPGVVVATGGSGHAFKFLPIIGRFVADRVEGKQSDMLDRFFKWRSLKPGEKAYNVIMRGKESPNALQNVPMSEERDLDLAQGYRAKL